MKKSTRTIKVFSLWKKFKMVLKNPSFLLKRHLENIHIFCPKDNEKKNSHRQIIKKKKIHDHCPEDPKPLDNVVSLFFLNIFHCPSEKLNISRLLSEKKTIHIFLLKHIFKSSTISVIKNYFEQSTTFWHEENIIIFINNFF